MASQPRETGEYQNGLSIHACKLDLTMFIHACKLDLTMFIHACKLDLTMFIHACKLDLTSFATFYMCIFPVVA